MSSVFVRHLAGESGVARALRAHLAELDPSLPIALAPPSDLAAVRRDDVTVFLVTAAALADQKFANDMSAAAQSGTLLAVRLDESPLPPSLHAFSMKSPDPAATNAAVAARLADWLDRSALRAEGRVREQSAAQSPATVSTQTVEPSLPPRTRVRPKSVIAAEAASVIPPAPVSVGTLAPRIRRTHGWWLIAGLTALLLLLTVLPALGELAPNPASMFRGWMILIAAFVLYPALGGLGTYISWSLIDPATASRPLLRTIGAAVLAAGVAAAIAGVAALAALLTSGWFVAIFGMMALALLAVIPASALAAGLVALAARRKIRVAPPVPAYAAVAVALVLMLLSGRPILRVAADNGLIADVITELDRVGYHVVYPPDPTHRKLSDARRDGDGNVTISLPKDSDFDGLRDRIVEFQQAMGITPTGAVSPALLDRLRASPAKTLWRIATDGTGDAIPFDDMVDRAGAGSIIEIAPGIHRVACPYMSQPKRLILRGTGRLGDSTIICDEAFSFMIAGGGRVEKLVIRAAGSEGSLDLNGTDERAIIVDDVRLDGVTLNASAPHAEITKLVAQDLAVSGGVTTVADSRFSAPKSRSAISVTLSGEARIERTTFAALGQAGALMVEVSATSGDVEPSVRFVENEVSGITDPKVPAIYVRGGAPEIRGNRLSDVAGPCVLIEEGAGGIYRDNRLDRCGRSGGPSIAVAKGATPTIEYNEILHPGGAAILRAPSPPQADVK